MKNKNKNKNKKRPVPLCSAERAINIAKWDNHSPWELLINKIHLEPWETTKLAQKVQ